MCVYHVCTLQARLFVLLSSVGKVHWSWVGNGIAVRQCFHHLDKNPRNLSAFESFTCATVPKEALLFAACPVPQAVACSSAKPPCSLGPCSAAAPAIISCNTWTPPKGSVYP